jgi:aminopeptidase N
MTLAGELGAAAFVGLAARGIGQGGPAHGLAELLGRAVTAANLYAPDTQRSPLLRHLADAAYAGAEAATAGSRTQRVLAAGYAASADGDAQLAVVAGWGRGEGLPPGLTVDLELRAKILLTLAAQGRTTDQQLDSYAAADPVNGAAILATCRASRPDPAAKQEAWQAALANGQRLRTAMAHAEGIWVPGQADLLTPFRARFFAEALPALAGHDRRSAQRLARLLYPVLLADAETLAATDEALASDDLAPPLRPVLTEQAAIVAEIMTARAQPA